MTYPAQKLITSSYEHQLACVYQLINNKGLLIDTPKLTALRLDVEAEIAKLLKELSDTWGRHVYIGADNDDGSVDSINLNSSSGEYSLVNSLKSLGYKVPLIRKRVNDGHSKYFEFKESANAEALFYLFAETNDQSIKKLTTISHLSTLLEDFITRPLWNDIWYCIYNVSGTDTGRRSCKKHIFNLGGNMQNLPKHDTTSYGFYARFRKCIIARPGKLFFSVDQMSAEEWPVAALSENTYAIQELVDSANGIGLSRHAKLASLIYNVPVDQIKKSSNEYYIGKKARHANNYKMQAKTMASACAHQGVAMSEAACKDVLDKVNKIDPSVQGVFHKYIKDTLYNTRQLVTPFGRERVFFGLRNNSDNYDIMTIAYAYIPQSTVGDNTGLAVLDLYKQSHENQTSFDVVHEAHDSITVEVPATLDNCIESFKSFTRAFNREITFHNNITLKIPIEGELSYNFCDIVKIKSWTEEGVKAAYEELLKLKDKSRDDELKDSILRQMQAV